MDVGFLPLPKHLTYCGRQTMSKGPEFEIAGRKIGPDHPPYIIAELSANHNGQLSMALDLIEAAVELLGDFVEAVAGDDAVFLFGVDAGLDPVCNR